MTFGLIIFIILIVFMQGFITSYTMNSCVHVENLFYCHIMTMLRSSGKIASTMTGNSRKFRAGILSAPSLTHRRVTRLLLLPTDVCLYVKYIYMKIFRLCFALNFVCSPLCARSCEIYFRHGRIVGQSAKPTAWATTTRKERERERD